jgi:hypothetical protein
MRVFLKIVVGVIAGLIAIPMIVIGLYLGGSELLTYIYYEQRPILKAMTFAPGLQFWVDDSQPAKHAFFQQVPLGTKAPIVAAALAAEGFECRRARSGPNGTLCFLEVRGFVTTYWGVHLEFDDASQLRDAKINLQSLSL